MAQGKKTTISVQNAKANPKNAQAVSKSVETEIRDGVLMPKSEESEPGLNIGAKG